MNKLQYASMNNISEQSLAAIARALRSGEISSLTLLEHCQARHQRLDSTLHAYQTWAPQQARQQARTADAAFAAGYDLGLLQGITVSLKDHFGFNALPTYAGTSRELPAKWRQEGPVVQRLKQQLAVITGKTHAVELAFGGIGLNNHWGTPRNPWDNQHHRVPGGSSSGAGVSLCEGSALLALGTDTGGSVRIPASMTGNVGLKTSYGRWSLDGIVPLSSSLDTAGILTRSVADSIYGFAAIDPSQADFASLQTRLQSLQTADLRIAIADQRMWQHCEDDIVQVVKAALDELAGKGAHLTEVDLPEVDDALALLRSGSVVSAEVDAFIEAELPEWRELLDPIITMRIADGGAIAAREYVLRQRQLQCLAQTTEQRFNGFDVIASPTLPIRPPRLDQVSDLEGYRPNNAAALSNTCVANMLRLCAITIPVGLDSEGLPVGLQLMARYGQEEHLLAVAWAVEKVLGTARERLGTAPLIT